MAYTITSIPSIALPDGELGHVLRDYVALDEARTFRRLLVIRFGLLAAVAILLGLFVPALPTAARWVPTVVFLVPPVWAWVHEFRLESRLSRRLDGVHGIITRHISRTFDLDDD